jgi:Tfp pilus assembly protein PilN
MILLVMVCVLAGWTGWRYLSYSQRERQHQDTADQYANMQQKIKELTQKEKQFNSWLQQTALLEELSNYGDFISVIEYLAENSPDLIYLEQMEFFPSENYAAQGATYSNPLPKAAKMFVIKENSESSPSGTKETTPGYVIMLLKGRSVNHQAVADYLNVLRSAEIFENIQLKYSRRHPADSEDITETVDFEIACVLIEQSALMGFNYAKKIATPNF